MNDRGQLGDNTIVHKSSPVQTIAFSTDWSAVSHRGTHGLSLKTDGTLWLWGSNSYGEIGDNTTVDKSSPVQTVAFGSTWSSISAGKNFSASIKSDGRLWLWGKNSYGQLGNNIVSHVSSPVQTVAFGTTWSKISSGKNHVGAIKTDGTLWLWGANRRGQLGDSTVIHRSSPVQTIAFGSTWSQVSCGDEHTAAIKTDGSLWVWGYNLFGQLATNNLDSVSSPVQTTTYGTSWSVVSAGESHTAATKTDGTLWLWGSNSKGQIGNTSLLPVSSPVQTIAAGTQWNKISCGKDQTAAIKKDGTLWLWGNNQFGEIGNFTSELNPANQFCVSSPVQTIAGGDQWLDVSVGGNVAFALAVGTLDPKNLWLWGANNKGQLGDGTTFDRSIPVQTIDSIVNWDKIKVGSSFMVGLTLSKTVWTWGDNSYGQIGDNTSGQLASKSSPVQTITYATNWSDISAGSANVAALKDDGSLWMWGQNNYGQLGDNSKLSKSSPVQTASFGTNWTSVSCSKTIPTTGFTLGVKKDGTLWSWGNNYFGQLGDNTTVHKSSPVQTITYATDWSSVACGHGHSVGIKTDGTLWTWGLNYYGQLGDSSIVDKSSPVQTVSAGTNWQTAACGFLHTVAVKKDGTLWSWGYGIYGQIGQGANVSVSSPVQTLLGGTTWSKIDCGYYHTIAQKSDGTIWSWGSNNG